MNTATKLINRASLEIEPVSSISYLEAEILLCFVKKISREELYLNPDIILSDTQEENFNTVVTNRAKGMPLAYITGKKEFYGRDFVVNDSVLIPRPETEMIIDETRAAVKKIPVSLIIDIGTGSGCIGITLALELTNIDVIACDIDLKALETARTNAKDYGVDNRITYVKSDLLKEIDKKADIVVVNLPYVLETDKENLDEKHAVSLKYEPHNALYAGIDGLDLYKRLVVELKGKLPKLLILEIDPRQAIALSKTINESLCPKSLQIKKDLAGHDRLIIASF